MKFIDGATELILMSQGIPYRTPKKIIKGVVGKEKPITYKLPTYKLKGTEYKISPKYKIAR